MTTFDLIAIAVIQGITEFLPISSSGHLALWPLLTGRADQGVIMDVAVHVGTLAAVMLFFRSEIGGIFIGCTDILRGRLTTESARLALLLALATIPAIIFGLALKLTDAHQSVRTIEVIGWTTLLGALLLWWADRRPEGSAKAEQWSVGQAVMMGLAQALALVPGVSRSGITMTAARWLGYDRVQAARLAMLMAVPIILAAGLVEAAGVAAAGDLRLGRELLAGAGLSFLSALAALWAMMRMFAKQWTMMPFVVYRVILGLFLLFVAYG